MNCPSCKRAIGTVIGQAMTIQVPGATGYKGLGYTCPLCAALISVSVDPIIVRSEITNAIDGATTAVIADLEPIKRDLTAVKKKLNE